jgi:hypothetical protein
MSPQDIQLRKLLRLILAPANIRRAILLRDLAQARSREAGEETRGGDFFGPFWADARLHVTGGGDLSELTSQRIAANFRRKRLYDELLKGFLRWWNEKRRWRNEPLSSIEDGIRGRISFPSLGAVVRVDGLLSLESGPDFRRLIYPYWFEKPTLSQEGARLALWAMTAALPEEAGETMRVLDVIRAQSYAIEDSRFVGDERDAFVRRYAQVIDEWERIRAE